MSATTRKLLLICASQTGHRMAGMLPHLSGCEWWDMRDFFNDNFRYVLIAHTVVILLLLGIALVMMR
jgi:hypothetical protein